MDKTAKMIIELVPDEVMHKIPFFYYEIRNNLVLIIEKKLQKKNMI